MLYNGANISGISIHAPLRERLWVEESELIGKEISIHAPLRERHSVVEHVALKANISIHAPLRERQLPNVA